MKARLTKKLIEGLKPKSRQYSLRDTEVTGLQVWVSPGGKKSYALYYRTIEGLRRSMVLGDVSRLPPSEIRKTAKKLLADVAKGKDPLATKQKDKDRGMTLSDLWKLYEADVIDGGRPELRKGRPPLRPATVRDYRQTWRLWIEPKLGKRKVETIDRQVIERFHDSMRSKSTAGNRALATLSNLFAYAMRRGLAKENPVLGIARYSEVKRERFLNGDELARLAEVLRIAEAGGGKIEALDDDDFIVQAESWQPVQAVRLALLTGTRRGELERLRWDDVDVEAGLIRIPHAKGGYRELALTPPVAEILDDLPRYKGNPFVLASSHTGKWFQGLGKCWGRIRTAARIEDVRWHDLRHSAASMAVSAGVSLDLVQVILGHKQRSTTEIYAHQWEDPQRAAAVTLANRMNEAMLPKDDDKTADKAEVHKFKRGAQWEK